MCVCSCLKELLYRGKIKMWLYMSGNGHKSIEDQTEGVSCPHTSQGCILTWKFATPSCNTNTENIYNYLYIYTQQHFSNVMIIIWSSYSHQKAWHQVTKHQQCKHLYSSCCSPALCPFRITSSFEGDSLILDVGTVICKDVGTTQVSSHCLASLSPISFSSNNSKTSA